MRPDKEQWGWAGFSTCDFERCQMMARLIEVCRGYFIFWIWAWLNSQICGGKAMKWTLSR